MAGLQFRTPGYRGAAETRKGRIYQRIQRREAMDKAEAMFLECDVLRQGHGKQITSVNADRIRCKILCEGANADHASG